MSNRARWFAAHATVFAASACTMIVELVAGRVISRHLGASIYTWTSVIGIILAGLALGNYVGGLLADRYRARPLLALLFVLSSATCVSIVVLNNLVGSWQALWDLPWPLRVAAHVATVFWIPAALLGTISPIVARRALGFGEQAGQTLGAVYAWGVIGSIAGTFATGYLLIDWMGTGPILWSVAALLATIGLLHAPLSLRSWGWTTALLICCLLANGSPAWCQSWGQRLALREVPPAGVIYSDESLYSRIEIRRMPGGEDLRGMYLDKLLHSQISMKHPFELRYDYARIFAELTDAHIPEKRPLNTLTIGGGGYVFPRYLEHERPGSRVEVVEIDPAVTRAARLAFGFSADSTIETFHSDGRVFVNRRLQQRKDGAKSEPYDVIYVDAVNDYSVPFQLTTREFFDSARRLLTPDGLLLINCIDVLDSGAFVGSLTRTLETLFPDVEIYTLGNYEKSRGDSRLTFVVAASARPIAWRAGDSSIARVAPEDHRTYVARGRRLTDSHAPVESLLAPVVLASSKEIAAADSLRQAIRREAAGDLPGFVRHAREALIREPNYPQAHYHLALGLYRQGRIDEAIDHWRHALRYDERYPEAHYNLGAVLFARGEADEALFHLLRAAELKPELAEAHLAVGIAQESRGDPAGATAAYERALRLQPQMSRARHRLARLSGDRFDPASPRP